AGRTAGLGVPGLELAGGAAEPQENAVLLLALGLLGEGAGPEQPAPTEQGSRARGGEPLEEKPPVDDGLGRRTEWAGVGVHQHQWFSGNSGSMMNFQSRRDCRLDAGSWQARRGSPCRALKRRRATLCDATK